MLRSRFQLPSLPLRAWLLTAFAALVLLLLEGGSLSELFPLLLGFMPLETGGQGYLHLLLGRATATFSCVSIAAVFGWSAALALTLVAGFAGRGALKILVWGGRFLGSLPPMAWALGLLVLLVQRWGVPVETLFPFAPPAEMDSPLLRAGRHMWAWMLPVATLALPAAAMMLAALAHRLEVLISSEQLGHLQARGIGPVSILHRHFLPPLLLDLVRTGRAVLPMLVGFSLPVEHIFGFDGLGRFAGQMLLTHEYPKALPATIYLAGWMLLLWFVFLGAVERRAAAFRVMPAYPEGEARAMICAIGGAVLLLALLLLPNLMAADETMARAYRACWRELLFVIQVVGVACVVVLISMPLWQGWDRIRPRWYFGLVSPAISEAVLLPVLLLSALSWLDVPFAGAGAGMLLSLGGMALLRAQAQELSTRRMVEASRMLGENIPGILKHHLLRYLLPSLGNWAFRMMSALLLWMSIIHWFVSGAADGANLSWGVQMRLASEEVFDDPRGVLMPAFMVALWCLSLQLLSRAFRADLPPQEIQPADPR